MQDVIFVLNNLESQTRTRLKIISRQSDETDSFVGQLSHIAVLSQLAASFQSKLTDKFGSNKSVFAAPGKHAALKIIDW
jgi:hypothetical protein